MVATRQDCRNDIAQLVLGGEAVPAADQADMV